jgi:hypothetical protein
LCCAKEYYSIISAAPFNLQEVNNQFEILNWTLAFLTSEWCMSIEQLRGQHLEVTHIHQHDLLSC